MSDFYLYAADADTFLGFRALTLPCVPGWFEIRAEKRCTDDNILWLTGGDVRAENVYLGGVKLYATRNQGRILTMVRKFVHPDPR